MNSLQDLSDKIIQSYRGLIDASRPVALVDFPDSMNSGDHAIWLGERALLRALGIEPAYECSVETYDRAAMSDRLGNGTILMHGGGNFGDIYTNYHELRLRLLKEFPDNPVVVFPQTMMFFSDNELRSTVRDFSAHGQVTLSARDALTFHMMRKHFGDHCRVILMPDMAMMLGSIPRSVTPSFNVVWIKRADLESKLGPTPIKDIQASLPSLTLQSTRADLGPFEDGIPTFASVLTDGTQILISDWYHLQVADASGRDVEKLRSTYKLDMDGRSWFWVERAMRLLSAGRVVITDRLHGHLLCTLAGIPHVLLNNSYGKNFTYYETWSRPLDICRLAAGPADALAHAKQLLLTHSAKWHETDLKRWSDPRNLHESWNLRSQRAAAFVRPGASLLDIGCGKMAIEAFLPAGCCYIPMDVVARDERTIVCDLNVQAYPAVNGVDHISMLGVLEYLNDPPAFWRWAAQKNVRLILSYIVFSPSFPLAKRREMGWVNDFGRDEIIAQAASAGFDLAHEETIPPDNTLFVFDRRPVPRP